MTATEKEPLEGCELAPPPDAAVAAGLRYVNGDEPGITREPAEDGFRYRAPGGRELCGEAELLRIRRLGIPPAWQQVWICADAAGHLQATGRDAKGRKQYRYHQRWRTTRDETKYERLRAFGQALPALRERLDADLALRGLPRVKVLAAVVSLLARTHIRVGNPEYARDNKSYGLTTLRDQHVKIGANKLRFAFKGKSGVRHSIGLSDRRLATIVGRCRDLPGQQLFQYLDDDGVAQATSSSDVNAYLRELTGQPFSAKDFRTWAGSAIAAGLLRATPPEERQRDARHQVNEMIEQVAAALGNTPTICRRCYIHPLVIDAYLDGTLHERMDRAKPIPGLDPAEEALLALLGSA